MKFVLTIDCENDAFGAEPKLYNGYCRQEVARLLRVAAQKVENGWGVSDRSTLIDENGNTVGGFRFEKHDR